MSAALSRVALDHICQIAARNLRSNIALIVDCDRALKGNVVGSFGCIKRHLAGDLRIPSLSASESDVAQFNSIQSDGRFHNHPLLHAFPGTRSLLAVSIISENRSEQLYLLVLNPSSAALKSKETSPLLADLTDLARVILEISSAGGRTPASLYESRPSFALSPSFHEASSISDFVDVDAAAGFLLATLISRSALHAMRDLTYVTARKWRMPLKERQQAAFSILKRNPCLFAEKAIAREIVEMVDRTFLRSSYGAVIPLPEDTGQESASLTARLAEQIAEQLMIPTKDCLLMRNGRKGEASPKDNMTKMFQVPQPVTGAVLLVAADSANSAGIECAVAALRSVGADPTAIAWLETGPSLHRIPKTRPATERQLGRSR